MIRATDTIHSDLRASVEAAAVEQVHLLRANEPQDDAQLAFNRCILAALIAIQAHLTSDETV